jgi:ABC-type uncharacterized transport system substrate-binding protein
MSRAAPSSSGTRTALAAKQATRTIPIVMATVGDPVGSGLVASLARPGGNITGLALMNSEMNTKRLELLKAILPGPMRVAGLANPGNPASALGISGTGAAARALGSTMHVVEARDGEDLGRAFAAMVREQANALIVLPDPSCSRTARRSSPSPPGAGCLQCTRRGSSPRAAGS